MTVVFRIVRKKAAATDLSGKGAFTYGGRWNSKGTYVLYTSENSSLSFLETLVHLDASELPPSLQLVELQLDQKAPVYEVPDKIYPPGWKQLENMRCKQLGDQWMASREHLAVKVRSAVNPTEYNYLLNPLFPDFNQLVKVMQVTSAEFDKRLIK